MLAIRRLAETILLVALLPLRSPIRTDSSRTAATTEHLFEGAQRPQQIGADESVVAGHDNLPGVRLT